jgi:hypothetical protein
LTCFVLGHAAWTRTCCKDMEMQHRNGHAAWTLTGSMSMYMKHGHGHAAWTWTMTCSMFMSMLHVYFYAVHVYAECCVCSM